ncbi:transposase, partial [Dehalococcoidia bacterium]|nr:transposase [Dehalococcoidia bacterium]
MRTGRNYANIARRVIDPGDDGQNFQQFTSDSPWSAGAVFDQIQAEVRQRPELRGGMLTLDESGDKKAGSQSAGVARQYLRTFSPKSQLGLEMILRAKSNGLPFHVVGCDSFYGRDSHLGAALDKEGLLYVVEVPSDTHVYLERPKMGVPEKPLGHRGRPFSRQQVLNGVSPVGVRQLRAYPDLEWQRVKVRPVERGALTYECTARRVWTLTDDGQVR